MTTPQLTQIISHKQLPIYLCVRVPHCVPPTVLASVADLGKQNQIIISTFLWTIAVQIGYGAGTPISNWPYS